VARNAKGLKTLVRLSKFNVDEKRRVLTGLQTREDQIVAEIGNAELRLKEEQKIAAADATGVGYLYGAYHQAWRQQRNQQDTALSAVRAQIEAAREDLAEAYRELKTYEITQANREKREQEEADRKEQVFLDEVGLTQFRRREEAASEG
jgi:flagellar export protein FliJ